MNGLDEILYSYEEYLLVLTEICEQNKIQLPDTKNIIVEYQRSEACTKAEVEEDWYDYITEQRKFP